MAVTVVRAARLVVNISDVSLLSCSSHASGGWVEKTGNDFRVMAGEGVVDWKS